MELKLVCIIVTWVFSEPDSLGVLVVELPGVDLASRSMETKIGLHDRYLGSSNARSTAMPVSLSLAKTSYSSGRRKAPHDNLLAQSVPVSELRDH